MSALDASFAHCETLVRELDPERYQASLFAGQAQRGGLLALAAFNAEIARVRDAIREPMAGEIRLQWWRDALNGTARGDASGHPVVPALLATIERARLPLAPFHALIDARTFDLYDDPMPTLGDLEGYAGETASMLVRLGSLVLLDGREPGGAAAAGHAGVAIALAGLMRALPFHARRGQVYLPGDVLARHGVSRDDIVTGRGGPGLGAALAELRAEARRHLKLAMEGLSGLPEAVAPAFLPLAPVEPHLRRMERANHDPLNTLSDRPAWLNLASMWLFARRFGRG